MAGKAHIGAQAIKTRLCLDKNNTPANNIGANKIIHGTKDDDST
ncbi:MAG: hypothetical protein ACI9LX_002919 [Paraglaciecola sp.]|jgi:hypothetical protein